MSTVHFRNIRRDIFYFGKPNCINMELRASCAQVQKKDYISVHNYTISCKMISMTIMDLLINFYNFGYF